MALSVRPRRIRARRPLSREARRARNAGARRQRRLENPPSMHQVLMSIVLLQHECHKGRQADGQGCCLACSAGAARRPRRLGTVRRRLPLLPDGLYCITRGCLCCCSQSAQAVQEHGNRGSGGASAAGKRRAALLWRSPWAPPQCLWSLSKLPPAPASAARTPAFNLQQPLSPWRPTGSSDQLQRQRAGPSRCVSRAEGAQPPAALLPPLAAPLPLAAFELA